MVEKNWPFPDRKGIVNPDFVIPRGVRFPMLSVGANGRWPSDEVVEEVAKAAIFTLGVLGVSLEKYKGMVGPGDFLDLEERDAKGNRTLRRKKSADSDVLVGVISVGPFVGANGEELTAEKTEDNKFLLNLCAIDKAFSGDVGRITGPQRAAIVVIEEVIHFVQNNYWGRPFVDNSCIPIEEYMRDSLEIEARLITQQVLDLLYPELHMVAFSQSVDIDGRFGSSR